METTTSTDGLGRNPGDVSPGVSYDDWALTNSITDPLLDDDQDGINNLTEYALGTDPGSTTPLTANESKF